MRVRFAEIVLFLGIAGCGETTPEAGQVSATPSSEAQKDADSKSRAEMSERGWPHTTKKHRGEFVYVAPDGTEKVLSLGDETVARITGSVHAVKVDEIAYELQYVRHRDGKDFYQITYQTGSHHHTTVGPLGYAGKEMPIGNKGDHGTFILRPESR